jgi:hypothetical protein
MPHLTADREVAVLYIEQSTEIRDGNLDEKNLIYPGLHACCG